MEKKKNYRLTKTFKKIREDLLDQLDRNNIFGEQYLSLIEEYMSYWVMAQELKDDLKEKGALVPYQNGEHQFGVKKNPAFDMLKSVHASMFKTLSYLGIKPTPDENYDREDQDDRL